MFGKTIKTNHSRSEKWVSTTDRKNTIITLIQLFNLLIVPKKSSAKTWNWISTNCQLNQKHFSIKNSFEKWNVLNANFVQHCLDTEVSWQLTSKQFMRKGNVGMFDSILFDNSKLIMFDNWKVSFLRKKSLFISERENLKLKVEQNINRT